MGMGVAGGALQLQLFIKASAEVWPRSRTRFRTSFTAPFQINKAQRTTQEERNVRTGRFGPDKEFTVGADGERLAADKELRAITVSVSSDVWGSVTQTGNTFTIKARGEDAAVFVSYHLKGSQKLFHVWGSNSDKKKGLYLPNCDPFTIFISPKDRKKRN